MKALQRMMGDTELTEENIRDAMQNLTAEQRRELLSEGQELKQELLTNQDHVEDRNLYFKEFNQRAEEAGMPIDQDGTYLAKKVQNRSFLMRPPLLPFPCSTSSVPEGVAQL